MVVFLCKIGSPERSSEGNNIAPIRAFHTIELYVDLPLLLLHTFHLLVTNFGSIPMEIAKRTATFFLQSGLKTWICSHLAQMTEQCLVNPGQNWQCKVNQTFWWSSSRVIMVDGQHDTSHHNTRVRVSFLPVVSGICSGA